MLQLLTSLVAGPGGKLTRVLLQAATGSNAEYRPEQSPATNISKSNSAAAPLKHAYQTPTSKTLPTAARQAIHDTIRPTV